MNELRVENVNSKGYGIIAKIVMQDKNLSIEAKGIYAYFCSFAGTGNTAFPSVGRICNDLGIKEERFRKHLNNLKEYDYIQVEQIKGEKGKFTRNIYTIVSNPNPSYASTEKPSSEKPSSEKPSSEKPSSEKPSSDKPCSDKPCSEKWGTNNNSIKNNSIKNNSIKNNSINNQSVSQSIFDSDEKNDGQTDGLIEILKNSQVETYDENIKFFIMAVIKELYTDSYVSIMLRNGLTHSEIKDRLKRLRVENIDRALYKLRQVKDIKNAHVYFAKCLLTSIVETGVDDYIREPIFDIDEVS